MDAGPPADDARPLDGDDTGRPRLRAGLARRALEALVPPALLAGFSMLLAGLLYQPWGDRISLPMSDGFDLQLHALFIKNLYSTGDYAHTNQVGAPFGQNLLDFPISGDRVHLWLFQLIGLGTRNPYTALSVYFLLGFGLVAVATWFVARELRLDRPVAALVTLLFTFLPYHFWHDEKHVFLSAYFPVPLGFLLAVWAIQGTLPIPRLVVPRDEWGPEHRRRLAILVACVLIGASSDSYYAMFAVFAVASAALLGTLGRRSWRTLVAGGAVAGSLAVVTVANNLREILWRSKHGVDHLVAQRPTADSERYALHLAQALLPSADHRVKALAALGRNARSVAIPGEGGTYLGVIGVVGFLVAVGWLLVHGLGRRGTSATGPDAEAPLPLAVGGVALAVTLISTVGGFGFVLAVLGFSQIRSWGRFVLYPALAGLVCVGWLLQEWQRRATGNRRLAAYAAIPVLLVVGFLDQVPASVKPHYASAQATIESERAFVQEMEQRLPAHAMVFQLPLTTFPEAGPIVNLPDYSLFIPYLLGKGTLRYSYGGLRGRASDWQVSWATHGTTQMVRGLALVGFDALYVDRRGYVDQGARLDRALRPLVGAPVQQSSNGNLRLYDLRPLRRRLQAGHTPAEQASLRNLILHSVDADFRRGFGHNAGPTTSIKRWMAPTGTIVLHNPLGTDRPVELRLHVVSPTDAHVSIDVLGQHRSVWLHEATRGHGFKLQLVLPPGDTRVVLRTDARRIPNPVTTEDQRIQVTGLVVDDPSVHLATRD